MSSKNQPQPRQLKMKIDPKDEGGALRQCCNGIEF